MRGTLYNRNLKRIGDSPILSTLLGIFLPVALVVVGFVVLWKYVFNSTVKPVSGSGFDADSIANALQYKMETWMGNGFDDMISILKPLDASQLRAVYKAFGKRPYFDLFVLGISLPTWTGALELDLFGWFTKELWDLFTYDEKTQMRNIWAKSGLTVTF